jgi:hypothetical protein
VCSLVFVEEGELRRLGLGHQVALGIGQGG